MKRKTTVTIDKEPQREIPIEQVVTNVNYPNW